MVLFSLLGLNKVFPDHSEHVPLPHPLSAQFPLCVLLLCLPDCGCPTTERQAFFHTFKIEKDLSFVICSLDSSFNTQHAKGLGDLRCYPLIRLEQSLAQGRHAI